MSHPVVGEKKTKRHMNELLSLIRGAARGPQWVETGTTGSLY